jgi:hypothetical protein
MLKTTRAKFPTALMLTGILMLTAMLIALGISRAQVETTSVGPLPDCDLVKDKIPSPPCFIEASWVKLSSFKKEIEAKGGTLEIVSESFNLRFPQDQMFKIPFIPYGIPPLNNNYVFEQNTETFVNVNYLLDTIAKESNLPVKLEGLSTPRLTVGGTTIVLGTPDLPVKTSMWRVDRIQRQLKRDLRNDGIELGETCNNISIPRFHLCTFSETRVHHIKVNELQGTLYASLEKHENGKFSMDVAAVNGVGILEMKLVSQTTYFVNDFKKLKAGQGETILLRLTNRIDARAKQYEIAELPKNLISAAK